MSSGVAVSCIPVAAQRAVMQSLLKAGLLAEVAADDDQPARRMGEDGSRTVLRITDAGLVAAGREPTTATELAEFGGLTPHKYKAEQDLAQRALDAGIDLTAVTGQDGPHEAEGAVAVPGAPTPATAAQDAPVAAAPANGRTTLRDAAQALLTAWDADGRLTLPDAVAALRAALADKPARIPRAPATPRPPRTDTKQARVLALLRRPEGTTIAQVVEATGWAPHTVRGFFAGLKKRQGIAVEVLDRVRQVGPDKQGAKGSYSIYRVAPAAG